MTTIDKRAWIDTVDLTPVRHREEFDALAAALGLIYVVRSGRAVKIGFTKNLAERIATLQSGNQNRLELAALFAGPRRAELALHLTYRVKRTHGEWYEDGEWVLNDLAKMAGLAVDNLILTAHFCSRLWCPGTLSNWRYHND